MCALLAGPLVPHPSAGRLSHSLILPVPRWLLVGAMWLSSYEPPGINRSSGPSEDDWEERVKRKCWQIFLITRCEGLCGPQTNDKLFWLRRETRYGDRNGSITQFSKTYEAEIVHKLGVLFRLFRSQSPFLFPGSRLVLKRRRGVVSAPRGPLFHYLAVNICLIFSLTTVCEC